MEKGPKERKRRKKKRDNENDDEKRCKRETFKRSELMTMSVKNVGLFFPSTLNNGNKTSRQKGRRRAATEDKLIITTVLDGEVFNLV